MTLILTVATQNKVVQASDRRVTFSDGSVRDGSNKAISVRCKNAYFSISYTGAAVVGGKSTDEWLLDYLADIHAGGMDFKSIYDAIIKKATDSHKYFSVPELSFVLCGYLSQRAFVVLISNYEKLTSNVVEKPKADFHGEYAIIKEGSDSRRPLCLVINGCELALTEKIHLKFKRLTKKRFFQNNNATAIANKLVDIIREASESPNYGKYIGKDCMTVAMSRNPKDDIEFRYHPAKASPITYGPHIIDPRGTIKGVEIVGDPNIEVKFFPRD
jgi:hypothetical protein